MIAEAAKTFLEFLKLTPRYLIALGVIAAILLFSPDKFLKFIGVFEFAQAYRSMLGLTLVVTTSLFAVSISSDGISFVQSWWQRRKFHRRMTNRLNCLTEDEKQILRYYLAEKNRANSLRIDDGVVQGLVATGIIYRSANLGNMSNGFAHNISDFALDYLKHHPNLLQGTTNTYRTDKQQKYYF